MLLWFLLYHLHLFNASQFKEEWEPHSGGKQKLMGDVVRVNGVLLA
jgi:hypothetical protein